MTVARPGAPLDVYGHLMRHRVTEAGQQVAALPPPAFVTAASALYDAGWVYGAPAGAAYQP